MNERIPTRPHADIEVGGADGVTVFQALEPADRDRITGAIEFIIEKLKHGLAMPPDPDALAYYEGWLHDLRTGRRAQRIANLRAGLGTYRVPGKADEDVITGDRR